MRPPVAGEKQEPDLQGIGHSQGEETVLEDQQWDQAWNRGDRHEDRDQRRCNIISAMKARPRRNGMPEYLQERGVEAGPVLAAHRRLAVQVKLLPDGVGGFGVVRGRLQAAHEPHAPIAIEDRVQKVERAVDDAPGDIAAERRGQLDADDVSAFRQEPRPDRYGERHDQLEQHLEQCLGGVEVAVDEA